MILTAKSAKVAKKIGVQLCVLCILCGELILHEFLFFKVNTILELH
ncbi:MAG: hypothetical protein O8C62_04555 [Candidatus Methanoperedens sp.]|nr:hypothetical protein [Candidatus Methanoperedens sp.]